MDVKRCCIQNCKSSANYEQYRGVTFHKFPKHKNIREQWKKATRCCQDVHIKQYVCSRHFYKVDFETYRDSKFALRAGAVPSIFPWEFENIPKTMDEISTETSSTAAISKASENTLEKSNDNGSTLEVLNKTTAEDKEKPEAGKIADSAKDILIVEPQAVEQVRSSTKKPVETKAIIDAIHNADGTNSVLKLSNDMGSQNITCTIRSTTPMLSKRGRKRKIENVVKKDSILVSDEKDESDSAFSVGTQIEAKDYGEVWHPAKIVEVDSDEIEVLVHYDNWSQRHDEWISMSSPRIRSLSALTASPSQPAVETKAPVTYKVGDRCLARWTNNRRFPATVRSVVGNGKYEMIFDDGYILICPWYSLSKMKERKSAYTAANSSVSLQHPSSSRKRFDPSLPLPDPLPPVPFHRHLFDPSRDYLGPKSERRELKRKLDVKALFNIGRRNSTNTNSLKRKKPTPTEEIPPAKKKKVRGRKKKDSLDIKPEVVGEAGTNLNKQNKEVMFDIKVEINDELNGDSKINQELIVKTEQVISANSDLEQEINENKYDNNDETKIVSQNMLVEQNNSNNCAEEEVEKKDVKQPDIDALPNALETKSTCHKKCDEKLPSSQNVLESITGMEQNLKLTENEENITESKCAVPVENDERHTDLTENLVVDDNPRVDLIAHAMPTVVKAADGTLKILLHPLSAEVRNSPVCTENEPIDEDDNYTMDIDEGLKLIAEAVESFSRNAEAELSPKPKLEDEIIPKVKESEMNTSPTAEEYPEAILEAGKWCCRWVNGEPQGVISDVDSELSAKGSINMLPRKSVLVEDERLPPGWQKVLVRRSSGSSAGKWDIVLVEPSGKRLRDKGEMRNYLIMNKSEELLNYHHVLMDFSVHRKLSRQMGWDITTSDGCANLPLRVQSKPTAVPDAPVVASLVATPLSKFPGRSSLSLKKKGAGRMPTSGEPSTKKKKKIKVPLATLPLDTIIQTPTMLGNIIDAPALSGPSTPLLPTNLMTDCAFIGSMRVEIIDNLFRCPAEGCFKNFRKDNLLRMHIKHYHRELRKFLGSTPKVSDLAYARTAIPEDTIVPKLKCEGENKISKPKLPPKTSPAPVEKADRKDIISAELHVDTALDSPSTPVKREPDQTHSSLQDSPKLRSVLENPLSLKRPKVLYPIKKLEMNAEQLSPCSENQIIGSRTPDINFKEDMEAIVKIHKLPDNLKPKIKAEPQFENLDFEMAISSHTVTKPVYWSKKQRSTKKSKTHTPGSSKSIKSNKKKGKSPVVAPVLSDSETWDASDMETMSSYGTPDSRGTDRKQELLAELETSPTAPPPNIDPNYLISETGEKIKIVRMKREEIINCHCGFGEEDGLMIQCELCLCWQHAICHNIHTEAQVPDKYTCSICLNPRRGRRSCRFLHDQSWLYEGALPGGAPDPALRRSHELTANLLRLSQVLHTLRLKFHIAEKKDHPKLYLWAKDWEGGAPERAHSKALVEPLPHVDLRDMFGEIGKENLPLKEEDIKDVSLGIGDIRPALSEDVGDSQRDDAQLGSLANLLSSPGGPTLELPISTSELERLAKSVQESEAGHSTGPEPEAAIESSTCRQNLLRHILRCQLLIDARLDSIEAQVAELESQEPSFEDDETAEFFPRTKQTIQMLHRDLNTLEELGNIT